jgi:hypothetical protein
LGSVDRHLRQIETDETVVAGEGFINETIEHTCLPPLVTPSAQRGLGAFAEPTGDVPRAAGDEPEQECFEAASVVASWPVTAERVLIDDNGKTRFDCLPDDVDNARMECEHEGDLHGFVAGFWIAP